MQRNGADFHLIHNLKTSFGLNKKADDKPAPKAQPKTEAKT
jgi:hypothetical protein